MAERLSKNPFEFNKAQSGRLEKIGKTALKMERDRYCSGFPHYRGGSEGKLLWNNERHNRFVGRDGRRMAREEGLSPGLQRLAQTTGETHDWRQLTGRGNDERASAEWFEEQIIKSGLFDPAVAKLGAKAILGTEPIFVAGPTSRIKGQKLETFNFESKEEELFVRSIGSGDFGEIYTPMGPFLADSLYAQRNGGDNRREPDLKGWKNFHADQTIFLERFSYPLRSAERVLATHKKRVLGYTAWKAQLIRDDRLAWPEARKLDLQFAKDPNKDFKKLRS